MNRASCALVLTLIFGAGCSSLLRPSTAPPTYYQIAYAPMKTPCSQTFGGAVKVWDFSTSSPYDRHEMVVLEGNRQVLYSGTHQWVAKPGTMVAQSLIRDLDLDSLFPQAVGPTSPVVAPLELSGRVLLFAWQKRGDEFSAVFEAEVTLTEAQGKSQILFKHSYRFESPPFKNNAPSEFARAMSGLVGDFSTNLRRDLCAALTRL